MKINENVKWTNSSQFNVSKYYRLYNKVRCRLSKLQMQYNLLCKRDPEFELNTDLSMYHEEIKEIYKVFDRLVSNSFICNEGTYKLVYAWFKQYPESLKDHSIRLLGDYIENKDRSRVKLNFMIKEFENIEDEIEKKEMIKKIESERYYVDTLEEFKKRMKSACLSSRKQELMFRLYNEMIQRKGWFGLFNTLTVSPECHEEVFGENSKAWTDYVRLVDRQVGIRCFGTWKQAIKERNLGNEFHRYFAVVERGANTGRLHIHVLHMMKKLPYGSYDPNRGCVTPCRRELGVFKTYWKFGYSSPIMVRFNINDGYGKLFWRWPYEMKGKQAVPVEVSNEMKIVNYLGKYLVKSYSVKTKKGDLIWRTRMS
jgi:hypothetical protein